MTQRILLLMLSGFLAGFVACQKPNGTATTPQNSSTVDNHSVVARPPEPKNYCKGCGESTVSSFGCIMNECKQTAMDPDEPIICPLVKTNNMMPIADRDPTAIAAAYRIRDSFLINTNKGQWYITYYYELGKLAHDKNLITASNAPSYLSFARELITISDAIQSGPASAVPITPAFKTRAQGFINQYRSNTTNPTLLGYLTNIEADLTQFVDKNVAYIRLQISL